VQAPEVHYARSGSADVAYQVIGEGPLDLLYIPGWISHLDLYWEEPSVTRFLQRLAAGFRLILFDRRGTGLSDRVSADDLPPLEARMEDARAVLDSVGSEKSVIFAQGYGCPLAIAFAATYPDRTKALVLYNPVAKAGERDDDYPWGSTPEEREAWLIETEGRWGTEEFAHQWVRRLAPSIADDTRQVSWYARVMRAAGSPQASRSFGAMNALTDVRALLPLLHVPTLVLQRQDVRAPKGGVDVDSLAEARYVAERIPGAKLVVVPGRDYLPWVGDQEALISEVTAFATGTRPPAEPRRVLLSVLFVDIVDSTGWLAKLGDERWRGLLAEQREHRPGRSRALSRHRGRSRGRWLLRDLRRPRTRDSVCGGDRPRVSSAQPRDTSGDPHGRSGGRRPPRERHRRSHRRPNLGSRRARRSARVADREGSGCGLDASLRGTRRGGAEGCPGQLGPLRARGELTQR
jgi:pimeloyl-ACP methyl ester carboxylesterase